MPTKVSRLLLAVALAALSGIAAPANARGRTQQTLDLERDVIPAVVQIAARIVETEGAAEPLERLHALGSGVVVSPDGAVLTSAHVVVDTLHRAKERAAAEEASFASGGRNRTVRVADDRFVLLFSERDEPPSPRFTATVDQIDAGLDLALLRISGGSGNQPLDADDLGLAFLPLGDSDAVELQARVVVVGYPGLVKSVVVTGGEVNGFETAPDLDGRAWIVTDATVSGGNSGGAALDASGRLIGITATAGALECRETEEDADAGCIPYGGSLAKLRPINQAAPLLAGVAVPAPVGAADAVLELPPTDPPAPTRRFDSPVFGWSMTWDEDLWTMSAINTDRDRGLLGLERPNAFGTAAIGVAPNPGDAGACADDIYARLSSDPTMRRIPATDDQGRFIAQRDPDRSYFAEWVTVPIGPYTISAWLLAECRYLPTEGASLSMLAFYPAEASYVDWQRAMEQLWAGIAHPDLA